MKNILQRDNQKRDKKTQRKHLSHCSLKEQWKNSREGVDARGKKWIYLKPNKEKNIKTMVLKIYL